VYLVQYSEYYRTTPGPRPIQSNVIANRSTQGTTRDMYTTEGTDRRRRFHLFGQRSPTSPATCSFSGRWIRTRSIVTSVVARDYSGRARSVRRGRRRDSSRWKRRLGRNRRISTPSITSSPLLMRKKGNQGMLMSLQQPRLGPWIVFRKRSEKTEELLGLCRCCPTPTSTFIPG
jgi:hypothetical protein